MRATCAALGGVSRGAIEETDTCLASRSGRLTLRARQSEHPLLIFYERSDVPAPRQSRSEATALLQPVETGTEVLARSLGVRCIVHKVRETFQAGSSSIHVDEVDHLGRFLDVVIDVEGAGGAERADEIAQALLDAFGLSRADVVPWSYAELQAMANRAAEWRTRLVSAPGAGTLFLFDGASCSGKSTLLNRLTRDPGVGIDLVPRYSTRAPRADDERCGGEYIFTSHAAFREMAFAGGFIEYRDFQFGMSYGLPWAEAGARLLAGRHAVGIINLGNVRHVKKIVPEAVTILVDASPQTIRARLIARGVNTPEQIEERLANAARVQAYRRLYDYVVTNEDGTLREAEEFLGGLVRRVPRQTRTP